MIIEILLVVLLLLWLLALLPVAPVANYPWASSWLAWFVALLLVVHLFGGALVR